MCYGEDSKCTYEVTLARSVPCIVDTYQMVISFNSLAILCYFHCCTYIIGYLVRRVVIVLQKVCRSCVYVDCIFVKYIRHVTSKFQTEKYFVISYLQKILLTKFISTFIICLHDYFRILIYMKYILNT